MRKLWMSVVPGRDTNADSIFHFHQELPKYLRGWHRVETAQAAQLAALVYRARFGDSKEELSSRPQVLGEILPHDQVKAQSVKDWTRAIEKQFSKQSKLSPEEAKTEFLKETYKWPTFGSTFFEVKPREQTNARATNYWMFEGEAEYRPELPGAAPDSHQQAGS